MAGYRLSNAAVEDLHRLWRYGLETWGAEKADAYYLALIAHFEILSGNPYLYPSVDHVRPGYRRSLCGQDSVYYRLNGETVEIMGRQDTDRWL